MENKFGPFVCFHTLFFVYIRKKFQAIYYQKNPLFLLISVGLEQEIFYCFVMDKTGAHFQVKCIFRCEEYEIDGLGYPKSFDVRSIL